MSLIHVNNREVIISITLVVVVKVVSLRVSQVQGRSQDFSKGGGGHTLSNIILMAFSPRNIVGCLLKKGLQRGGGSRAPQDPPRYALEV